MGVSRGDFGKWLWDGSQESIDKIHGMLFKGKVRAALRRTPSDLVGYPEISRALTPLDMTGDEIVAYNLVWEEFKSVMQNAQNKRTKKGEDNILVAKLRLREKASFLKIPYTVEYIEDMLDNGYQVAVSVAFKDTLHEIVARLAKKKIDVSLIYGELNATEKEEQRMKFQTGENKVVIFTVEEAISLHQGEYNDAPRTMLIHDLRWSAISMSQIEGRTHRDGKFSQIYWLYFGDTIEHIIFSNNTIFNHTRLVNNPILFLNNFIQNPIKFNNSPVVKRLPRKIFFTIILTSSKLGKTFFFNLARVCVISTNNHKINYNHIQINVINNRMLNPLTF